MPMETMDELTPSAGLAEDDRTPIIPETHGIAPRSLPIPPHMHSDDTIRASSHSQRPLMSPFRTFDPQSNMLPYHAAPMSQHPQYIDPSAAFYPQPHAQHPYTYPDGSSQDQTGFAQMAPPYVNMHPQMGGQMYAPQAQYYVPAPTDFEDPAVLASRHGSPTSSAASSSASIARSGSTSSDPRPARPKVKLTYEDKKHIVELHRANSSLRQEDIARIYGSVQCGFSGGGSLIVSSEASIEVRSVRSSLPSTGGLSRRKCKSPLRPRSAKRPADDSLLSTRGWMSGSRSRFPSATMCAIASLGKRRNQSRKKSVSRRSGSRLPQSGSTRYACKSG